MLAAMRHQAALESMSAAESHSKQNASKATHHRRLTRLNSRRPARCVIRISARSRCEIRGRAGVVSQAALRRVTTWKAATAFCTAISVVGLSGA